MSRGNSLPTQPFRRGNGHLQKAANRQPRVQRVERVRRPLLLQARLL
jgi:hypothetical protein